MHTLFHRRFIVNEEEDKHQEYEHVKSTLAVKAWFDRRFEPLTLGVNLFRVVGANNNIIDNNQ